MARLQSKHVIAVILAFGALVLILGSLHHGEVKSSHAHTVNKAAIKLPWLGGRGHAVRSPFAAQREVAAANDTSRVVPGLSLPPGPIDDPIVIPPKATKFPWLPGVTGRTEGIIRQPPSEAYEGRGPSKLGWSVISPSKPRALRVYNTLSAADCDELIMFAEKFMERSQVIATTYDGKSEVNNVRTSSGMFMSSPAQVRHPVNQRLHASARAIIGLPDDTWLEATQILRYEPGQFYRPHTDYFDDNDKANMNRGGQRLFTILTWLNDVAEGGETTFPNAAGGMKKAKPAKGQSVLFYNVDEGGHVDFHSTHGGDPPKNGTKWVAVIWCHGRTFV